MWPSMAKSGWACLARRRHQRWWQADARSAERDGGYQHGDHGYQGFSEHTDTDRTTSQHNRIHRSPLGFIAITSAQFQTVPNYEEIRNPDYTEAAVFMGANVVTYWLAFHDVTPPEERKAV